ncbi:MAG: DNA methyltransferase [Armatimonadota bacterium]
MRKRELNSAWERLYYRLDDEANAVIRWSFTKPKGEPKNKERLADHLAELGVSPEDDEWWEAIDWDAREPITVLDPFMGGGTTVVEALRLGANVVGVDLNPVAWFIVKKETDGCDLDALQEAFEQVEADVAEEIKRFYRTTCPCCGEQADVMYVFWVKLAPCLERTCGATVPLYNSFVIAKKGPAKTIDRDVPRNRDGQAAMLLEPGKYRGIEFIKCPNPECDIIYGSKRQRDSRRSTCPACGITFDPTAGYAGNGRYTCQECGSEHDILDAAKQNVPEGADRNVPLPHEMFGVEFYCPHCNYKAYKAADEDDRALFEEARAEFEANRESLDFPTQAIPPQGLSTAVEHDLPGHGYHYWYELFNERQLLCLCRLRDAIMRVEDQNLREYLLLAWSATLEFNCMFVSYDATRAHSRGLYSSHALVPVATATEATLWGTRYGRGSFASQYSLIPEGLQWAKSPSDNFFRSETDYQRQQIGDSALDRTTAAELHARSSEDLSSLHRHVSQLAVTDPPCYGNVMYGELSDFYYVWLRSALEAGHTDAFGPLLTPKEEEVVETVTRGHGAPFLHKDEEFFTTALTRIFQETARHMEDDGLLVFTFHHQANEAWASVLRTVLNADFNVIAVIPVHAEMRTSLHIQDKANISYDAVIVCRKQTEPPREVQWVDVSDQIWRKAAELVQQLEGRFNPLASEDIYVIAIGKCMEEYSQHYYRGQSFVTHKGKPVGIEEALNGNPDRGIRGIGEIVDELVEEAEGRMWPAGLDPISRFYVINFLGQTEVPWDRLQRRIVHNPQVDIEELERQQLVKESGGKVKVVPEMDRAEHLLERYHNGSPQRTLIEVEDPHGLSYIDRLHLLYVMDCKGMLTAGLLEDWKTDGTFVELARDIAEHLDPKHSSYRIYRRIAQQLSGQVEMRFGT